MRQTKRHQISFKLAPEDYEQTLAEAEIQEISVADFSRKLHRAAILLYRKCGGLREMRDLVDRIPESSGENPIRGKPGNGKRR